MLKLALTLDQERIALGQPIHGKLSLQNAGDAPQLVNCRLTINKSFAPAVFREVYFTLNDPSGKPVDFMLKINIGEPRADDFRELAAGESAETEFDLDMYYMLEQPGTYSLQANYENHAQPDDGREAWTGKVKSDPVEFALVS
jgi:hypothetical protein